MNSGRQRVAAILCRRDNITFAEAEDLINQALEEMEACSYNTIECEEIMMNNLGLEMDYIFDLLA
jgi:hypothetical protein